jgi:hypothetical protein
MLPPQNMAVNFLWNKGGGEGKDDIPASGVTKDDTAVLSARYTKGIEPNLLIQQKYTKVTDEIAQRLGTGTARRGTLKFMNQNMQVIKDRMDLQAYDNEQKERAKNGYPGFAKGKQPTLSSFLPSNWMTEMPFNEPKFKVDPRQDILDSLNRNSYQTINSLGGDMPIEKTTPVTTRGTDSTEVVTGGKGISGIGNYVSSGLGLIGGLSQLVGARNQSLHRPNIMSTNPYERQALTALSSLRTNVYPQLQAARDAEARNRYAIRNTGGLTGAQRYLAGVAGGIGLQRTYADILNRANEQNNQYTTNWASTALNAGNALAQRQIAANQYADEAYTKAHGARMQQEQMGMRNMLDSIQQFYANEFKRKQFNRTMSAYDQDYDLRRRALIKGKAIV